MPGLELSPITALASPGRAELGNAGDVRGITAGDGGDDFSSDPLDPSQARKLHSSIGGLTALKRADPGDSSKRFSLITAKSKSMKLSFSINENVGGFSSVTFGWLAGSWTLVAGLTPAFPTAVARA